MVLVFSVAILYGSTYQQFRHFDLASPGGAADATYYVEMSRGNFEFAEHHRYRWLTPSLARLVRPALENALQDTRLAATLSFYLVNFAFSVGACIALFALLQLIGFSIPLALLGVCAFASSRATVLATATPLVDAAYFFSIATLLYLTVWRKFRILAALLPLMILTKETLLPFLLLPLLTDMRKSPAYWVALPTCALSLIASHRVIDSIYPAISPTPWDTVLEHLAGVPDQIGYLFTPAGIHDLLSGFSLIIPLAAVGAWLNARHRLHPIPRVMLATIPIALGFALLSGNLGRMFFAAFPCVIAYALIAIEHVARAGGRDADAR
jgi:hypothetical protein